MRFKIGDIVIHNNSSELRDCFKNTIGKVVETYEPSVVKLKFDPPIIEDNREIYFINSETMYLRHYISPLKKFLKEKSKK